jgi:hypothetical protein
MGALSEKAGGPQPWPLQPLEKTYPVGEAGANLGVILEPLGGVAQSVEQGTFNRIPRYTSNMTRLQQATCADT